LKSFPFCKQHDMMDCGPACLQMISKFYGKYFSLQFLRSITDMSKSGVSLHSLEMAGETLGFSTMSVKAPLAVLGSECTMPVIAHWNQNHFVVIYRITRKRIYVADPATGKTSYNERDFLHKWSCGTENDEDLGIVMVLEPTAFFFSRRDDQKSTLNYWHFLQYLSEHRTPLFSIALGLVFASLINLIFPVLFQTIVDSGIREHDFNLIYLIIIAQVVLYLSSASIEFLRRWTLLHTNFRIIMSIQLNFLSKLMKLTMSFFESKRVGDIVQRFDDQQKIQTFLTGTALTTIFSMFNFVLLTIMIVSYSRLIFGIFAIGSVLYILWIVAFIKRRARLDYQRFDAAARNQTYLYQLISGMPDIKLNNSQSLKVTQWKGLQEESYSINTRELQLSQVQQGGAVVLNQIKNVCITCFSATAVIKGEMTIGVMMAIQYLIGQMNGPIEQLVQFIQTGQDALISINRLNEIHSIPEEPLNDAHAGQTMLFSGEMELSHLSFKYPGRGGGYALRDIDIAIPIGKTTAIVGMSGSGKTSLLKVMMRYYAPTEGEIIIDGAPLDRIGLTLWRDKCGVVLQDGYIFPDTILNNIVVNGEPLDQARLANAISVSNIVDFVNGLPAKMNTKIGPEGTGLSGGQKQRILIARAVYKDPEIMFLDEATNSLDSQNEGVITDNLRLFFKDRTVIIAAHRLSSIRHAALILVMHNGRIVERGTHESLLATGNIYYKLFKNQIEVDA
jgi:ATP-binding cassette subfamily B protein